ncbi:hypothetical protein [Sphingomonas sp. VNH70]|uniref:hypothetical protein n=1 Tax=Sphingomonas silueang TaxID=3156617 RepID=UPI0032B3E75D
MNRAALILTSACLLTGCESQAEKDRKAKVDYATYTAGACEHAKSNIAMVQSTRAIMNKPAEETGLEGFAKTVCAEADKAAKEVGQ